MAKLGKFEICDVTLRDGEQMPGICFGIQEKLEIARALDSVGVEVIEAGFPAISAQERRAVSEIVKLGLNARISCLSRPLKSDIDACLDCDVDCLGIFITTSDYSKIKYPWDKHELIQVMLDALDYAKQHGVQVRFAAEDATRTQLEFLREFYRSGEAHGADMVSIADTVGILTPKKTSELVEIVKSWVNIPICLHLHNDLGLALANAIAGLESGAFQIHTTVNGIGERAGNPALEELLVVLKMHYGVEKYELKQLYGLSKLVEKYSGISIHPHKPVVGSNAFTHESGIHLFGVLKDPRCYEPYPPEWVGQLRRYTFGKHTGKSGLKELLHRFKFELDDPQLESILDQIKSRAQIQRGSLDLSQIIQLIA